VKVAKKIVADKKTALVKKAPKKSAEKATKKDVKSEIKP
jgi:hypothetical protein